MDSNLNYCTKCQKIHQQKKKDNKEIPNTKYPKQLNTEKTTKQLGEKKKSLTYAPKLKNNRAFPEEKTTFRKLSTFNYLTVMNKVYEY